MRKIHFILYVALFFRLSGDGVYQFGQARNFTGSGLFMNHTFLGCPVNVRFRHIEFFQ